MNQKEIKIIGLSFNDQTGIVKACELQFNPENRLIPIKGRVGQGKSTVQDTIKTGVLGKKNMPDPKLYGDKYSTRLDLLDGGIKLSVGVEATEGSLQHTIYRIDEKTGKKIDSPVIDGIKAKPSTYLQQLQTELTWRMDDLCSKSQTTHRKVLLELFKKELAEVGVVFSKSEKGYEGTILHKIEQAEQKRTIADSNRKMVGGIADDLKAQGFNPDRPATLPQYIDEKKINARINELNTAIAVKQTKATTGKDAKLSELKNKGIELKNKCIEHNHKLEKNYDKEKKDRDIRIAQIGLDNTDLTNAITKAENILKELVQLGYKGKEVEEFIISLPTPMDAEKLAGDPIPKPNYIKINENSKVVETDIEKPFVKEIQDITAEYRKVAKSETVEADIKEEEAEIEMLKSELEQATFNNGILKAVEAFEAFRECDHKVKELQAEYVKMLGNINTGVEGLKIVPDEIGAVYLMYNGHYDPAYFGNTAKEYRKLSSYSKTQQPMICLIIQNYLLSRKPKALRYLFIDDVPIDEATRAYIEKICVDLNLWIFLNITGDYEKEGLAQGEFLIEGGEIFFNES